MACRTSVSHVPGPGLRPYLACRARSRASSWFARWEGDEPCWAIEIGMRVLEDARALALFFQAVRQ